MPMLHHTGFEPREARHILESALCGTCHTVISHPPSGSDQQTVQLVEQGTFLEWLASRYPRDGRSCQQCHMPSLQDGEGRPVAQYIAHRPPGGPFPPTRPRIPFGQHKFAGGNVILPVLMARGNLQEESALKGAAERARRQLERALQLRVSTRRSGEILLVTVDVVNTAGHKLPTGFPSRRLWLSVALSDSRDRAVFESGAWRRETGTLAAGETFQPHHRIIERPDQVQIFETEYLDALNRPTSSLLMAARVRKDNRILPAGFEPKQLGHAGLGQLFIYPVGTAEDDSFTSGSARTLYRIRLPDAPVDLRLKVEALFQVIKPSHLPPLFQLPDDLSEPIVLARFETEP
jgi:hypothetical protein